MYKHLLVPVTETPASRANVEAALKLARQFGARVTFFHALPAGSRMEEGARSGGDRTAAAQPLDDADPLLVKAAMSAKAAGVEAAICSCASDRPAEAIVEAAQENGCDLIVMASRGAPGGIGGWMHSSQTERVLRQAPVALLVTRVEASQPLRPDEHAIGIIHDEHRSIAVVVQGMRSLARDIAAGHGRQNCIALERMAAYLYEFPERVHHPKEEHYLHRFMRQWSPHSAGLLDEIEEQHRVEHDYLDKVSLAIGRVLCEGSAEATAALVSAVDRMADAMLQHLSYEERVLLPLAESTLEPQDWQQIADAFKVNDDPRYGNLTPDEFRRTFTWIVNALAQTSHARVD